MTDSRKPDAGCPCMAYQDQLPLYARSARVPDERFIPWRFCPWCGRDAALDRLSVVSPPADKILGYRVEVDPKMPPNEIRLVGMDGQSITYVLPPAAPPSDTEERA